MHHFSRLALAAGLICGAASAAVLFGSETSGAVFDDMNIWIRQVGGGPIQSVRIVSAGWADPASTTANGIANVVGTLLNTWEISGAVPVVSWEPYAYKTWSSLTPNTEITNGVYDDYLDAFFSAVSQQFVFGAAPARRLYLRFAPAPNGDWFPWSPTCPPCGNQGQYIQQTASSYVAMWKYVRAFGSRPKYNLSDDTVQWIFNAATYNANGGASAFYPGDSETEWVGLTGANYGTTINGNVWTNASALIDGPLAALAAIAPSKPVALLEVSSVSIPNGVAAKGDWLAALLGRLPAVQTAVRMVAVQNADAGSSDLAVFGGIRGAMLWTTPASSNATYWCYPSVAVAIGNTNVSTGAVYVGPVQTDARIITDAQFRGTD